MISKIQIRGFRKHKKLSIEFGPNVNTIIGPSYAGKSALIRALRWTAVNKPAGVSFINWDEKQTAVRLTVDKQYITRTRSRTSTNKYELDKKEFKAFGNDVPDEIRQLLNLSHVNWQGQHEAPFWFCETAGEVSRQLNSIINLEVIDRTLASLASTLKYAKVGKTLISIRLEEAKKEVESLLYAKQMDTDLTEIESFNQRISENAAESSVLSDLLKRVVIYASEQEQAAEAANRGKIAIDLARSYRDIRKSANNLEDLLEQAKSTQKEVKRRPPPFESIEALKTKLKEADEKYNNLYDLLDDIESGKDKLCRAKETLKIRKNKFKEAVGNECPICGGLLTKKL